VEAPAPTSPAQRVRLVPALAETPCSLSLRVSTKPQSASIRTQINRNQLPATHLTYVSVSMCHRNEGWSCKRGSKSEQTYHGGRRVGRWRRWKESNGCRRQREEAMVVARVLPCLFSRSHVPTAFPQRPSPSQPSLVNLGA
jgi:hypothetical protein